MKSASGLDVDTPSTLTAQIDVIVRSLHACVLSKRPSRLARSKCYCLLFPRVPTVLSHDARGQDHALQGGHFDACVPVPHGLVVPHEEDLKTLAVDSLHVVVPPVVMPAGRLGPFLLLRSAVQTEHPARSRTPTVPICSPTSVADGLPSYPWRPAHIHARRRPSVQKHTASAAIAHVRANRIAPGGHRRLDTRGGVIAPTPVNATVMDTSSECLSPVSPTPFLPNLAQCAWLSPALQTGRTNFLPVAWRSFELLKITNFFPVAWSSFPLSGPPVQWGGEAFGFLGFHIGRTNSFPTA